MGLKETNSRKMPGVKHMYYVSKKNQIIAYGILFTGFITSGLVGYFLKPYFLDRSCEHVQCPHGSTCVDTGVSLVCVECKNGNMSFVWEEGYLKATICTETTSSPTTTALATTVSTTTTTKPSDPVVLILPSYPTLLNLVTMEYNEDLNMDLQHFRSFHQAYQGAVSEWLFYNCGMMLNGRFYFFRKWIVSSNSTFLHL